MSLNQLTVSGFIGGIDASYLPSGKAMTKGYVKVGMGKDKEGNWKNEILGFVSYGDVAEAIAQSNIEKIYVLKGKLNLSTYNDASGTKRKWVEMVVFEMELDVLPQGAAPQGTHAPSNRPTGTRQAYSNGPAYTPRPKAVLGGLEDQHPF